MKLKKPFPVFLLCCLTIFWAAVNASAEDFNALKERGRFFIEKEWYEDAEKDLTRAIKDYPKEAKKDADVHFYLALLHYKRTIIEKAIAELDIAIAIRKQDRYGELKQSILTEFGPLVIKAAEKISEVSIRIETKERFISPRKKVVFNLWENRFENERFDLPLSRIYLPVGQYQLTFRLPGRETSINKEIGIEPDGEETKIYLLLIEPPVKVEATGQDRQVELTWEKLGVGTYTGFEVYRKKGAKAKTYSKIGDTKKTSFTDVGLDIGTEYSYKIRAYDPQVEMTAFTPEITATTLPLNPPTEIVALGEDRQIKLYWVASSGSVVTGYLVYRSSSQDQGFKLVGELGNETSYIDYDLDRGETYIYKIKTFNSFGMNSSYSAKVTARTMKISAPQKIRIRPESNGVNLLWQKVTNAKSFNIYRGQKKLGKYELIAQIPGRDLQFIDILDKPEEGLNFWYKLTSIDKQGKETRPSPPVSLSQPQSAGEDEKISGREEELFDEEVSSAPDADTPYKVYFSLNPDERFVEAKVQNLFDLISGLKPRQKIYYKIVSFDEKNIPDASFSFSLKVSRVNQPPAAVTGGDRQVMVNQSFLLDGSGSSDPENDRLFYKWVQRLDNPNSPKSLLLSLEPKVEMKLTVPGEYVFYLEVNDGELNNIQTVIIEVIGD